MNYLKKLFVFLVKFDCWIEFYKLVVQLNYREMVLLELENGRIYRKWYYQICMRVDIKLRIDKNNSIVVI